MDGLVSGFGLGYGVPSIRGPGAAGDGVAQTSPMNDVDALMKHCLQQCLDYHEEKIKEEENNEQTDVWESQQGARQFIVASASNHLPTVEVIEQSQSATTVGIPESPPAAAEKQPEATSSQVVVPPEVLAKAQSIAKKLQKCSPLLATNASPLVPSLEEARTKAQAVVASLSHQQQQPTPPPVVATVETSRNSPLELPPAEHLKRRRAHFQREQERFHQALMRNFAYVARREEQRLKEQLEQIENQKKYAEDLRKAQIKQLQERKKQMMLATTAGLGTKQQRKVEQRKRKMGHTVQERKQRNDDTVAIYLMGLHSTVTEEMIRPLFQSYGDLQKVHFYRDKSTRKPKGDALLVYKLETEEKRNELLESVCGQMNGAELPDGTVLQVQPASSECKKPSANVPQGVPPTASTTDNEMTTKAEVEKEEELDDFFASLA